MKVNFLFFITLTKDCCIQTFMDTISHLFEQCCSNESPKLSCLERCLTHFPPLVECVQFFLVLCLFNYNTLLIMIPIISNLLTSLSVAVLLWAFMHWKLTLNFYSTSSLIKSFHHLSAYLKYMWFLIFHSLPLISLNPIGNFWFWLKVDIN
jgi:hypothetical protein